MRPTLRAVLLAACLAGGCATTGGREGLRDAQPETGTASFYARRFQGRVTASGERYDERALTAAHRTLPFGTRLRITNLENGRSVVVTVTDRGPADRGRVVDLSRHAARQLGFVREGTARVRLDVVGD